MIGRRVAALVLIPLGIAVMLWGVNRRNSTRDSPPAAAGTRDDYLGIIGGGAILALVGFALAAQRHNTVQSLPPTPVSFDALPPAIAAKFANKTLFAEVVMHIQNGRKITAIKVLRDATHCGLKDGKDLVDELERKMRRGELK
jgi:ribosomal protein L7/L12